MKSSLNSKEKQTSSNGTQTRRERERAIRRNEIIAAAKDVFAERGFVNATLDEIAEKAEFGKGTLYNYFESKDELFEAVVIKGYDGILDKAGEVLLNADGDIRETLTRVVRELLELLMSDSAIFVILMREFDKIVAKKNFVEKFPHLVNLVEAPIRKAIEEGKVKECNSTDLSVMLIDFILSSFRWNLINRYMRRKDDDGLDTIMKLTQDEKTEDIEKIIWMLDITFFTGILVNEYRNEK